MRWPNVIQGARRLIVGQAQIGGYMLPDRYRHWPPGCRRCHDLHARSVGQARGKERVFSANALMSDAGDLSRKAPKQSFGELRSVVTLDCAAECFNPDFAWSIYEDIRDIGALQLLD